MGLLDMKKIILMLSAISLMPIFTAYADDTFIDHQYDAKGRVTSERDEQGNVAYYGRDAHGRINRVTTVEAPPKPIITPQPSYSSSTARPSYSASAPATIAPSPIPQLAPRPQLPGITQITPRHEASSGAEICIWLHDDGYNDLSSAQIEKIRLYCEEHGKNIAEIGSAAALELLK